jgi:predicted glycosyltransferase
MKKILFYCDTVFGVGGVQRVLAEPEAKPAAMDLNKRC